MLVRQQPMRLRQLHPGNKLRDVQVADVVRRFVTGRRSRYAGDDSDMVAQAKQCPEQDRQDSQTHNCRIGRKLRKLCGYQRGYPRGYPRSRLSSTEGPKPAAASAKL